jgi:hypothetical protein
MHHDVCRRIHEPQSSYVDVNLTVFLRFVPRNYTYSVGRNNDFRLQEFSTAASNSTSFSLSTYLLSVLFPSREESVAQTFSRICELLSCLEHPLEFTITIIIIIIIIIINAIEFSLGGSSPYTNHK